MVDLVLVGAGPIGLAAAHGLMDAGHIARVALAMDLDEAARKSASDAFECPTAPSFAAAPSAAHGDIALLTFSSSADATGDVCLEALRGGYDVVTTCEELSNPTGPWRSRLDGAAHTAGRCVVVTGANPGFVMDRLVVALASGSRAVRKVAVSRRVDTSHRRGPLVAKTGRGLSEDEFRTRVSRGELGHVGLGASVRLIADALGWEIGSVDETIEPVVDHELVAGLHQQARAGDSSGRTVVLDLTMAWGLDGSVDRVVIDGDPPVTSEILGGYHGDRGTTACVVDAVGRLPDLAPGFWLPTAFV